MSDLPAKPPHFHMRWYWLVFVLILLFSVFPIFLMATGIVIAGDHGCTINEGNTTPCMIDGTDWGPTLVFFGLSPLFLIATFPLAFVFFLIWLIILLVHRSRWNKRQRGLA